MARNSYRDEGGRAVNIGTWMTPAQRDRVHEVAALAGTTGADLIRHGIALAIEEIEATKEKETARI